MSDLNHFFEVRFCPKLAMTLNIGRMGRLVQPKPKFLDSWETYRLSKAALKRSLNFSIFIDTTGTLILAHCVKTLMNPMIDIV